MKLSTRLYRMVCSVLACSIEVNWEGQIFKHVAWSQVEALDWARQYPADCSVRIVNYKPY